MASFNPSQRHGRRGCTLDWQSRSVIDAFEFHSTHFESQTETPTPLAQVKRSNTIPPIQLRSYHEQEPTDHAL